MKQTCYLAILHDNDLKLISYILKHFGSGVFSVDEIQRELHQKFKFNPCITIEDTEVDFKLLKNVAYVMEIKDNTVSL